MPLSVKLSDVGSFLIGLSSITVNGDFAETDNCAGTVQPGTACTVQITFTPTASGARTGTMVLADSAAGSPETVSLEGTGGVPFTLSATETAVTVPAGSAQAQFTLSVSTQDGLAESVSLACANIAPAVCSFNPANIRPGETSVLTVGNLGGVSRLSLNSSVTGRLASATGGSGTDSAFTSHSTTSKITSTLPLTVQFEDFALSASPAENSVLAGQSAAYTLTVAPENGFNMAVSLARGGVPAQSNCSLSSASVSLDGPTPAKVTVAVETSAGAGLVPPEG